VQVDQRLSVQTLGSVRSGALTITSSTLDVFGQVQASDINAPSVAQSGYIRHRHSN
jgi:hypothetical protein